ncbi:MAG: aliphatic sulfonate ABC transporter substrate-binding protein [Caulobacterales bacterium]
MTAALATTLVSGCVGGGAKSPRVRIGHQKNGVLLLARRSGRLERALAEPPPAEVSWLEFSAGPPLLEAMSVGSLDVGSTGDAPPVFAQASGAPIMYVAAVPLSGSAGGILVPAGSTAQTVADLRGKRFCFTRASSAHNSAAVILEQAGLSLDDIEHINLSPADAAVAFAQGGIDAWLIWDPYFTAALKDQGARVLGAGGLPPSSAFILAHRDFVEEQPDLLKRVLSVLSEEGRWASENRADVAALQARETGLPLALLLQTVERDDFNVRPITPEVLTAQQAIADRFLRLGLIPQAVDVAAAAWTGWTPA